MTRVAVSKDVLDWALMRSDSSAAIKSKFPKLEEWRSGGEEPTLRQLEQFAKATDTPFGYFFLAEPPVERLPFPHFRTLKDKGVSGASPDLIDTVHTMERRQSWMRDYLVKQGQEVLPFVASAAIDGKVTETASSIRKSLGLSANWASALPNWTAALAELRNQAEAAGILIFSNGIVGNSTNRKLDPEEFRGFVIIDQYAPLIFINSADGKAAQMFTLAHELAHVWLGKSAAFDLHDMEPANDKAEQACNQIAAEFLLPETELRSAWKSVKNAEAPFDNLARQFKVSQLVAARRALDVDLVNKAQFFGFYRAYQEQERKAAAKGAGGDFYVNQNLRIGKRFAAMVIRAAKEGDLLYRDAYQLTGLYGKTFDQYANTLGSGA